MTSAPRIVGVASVLVTALGLLGGCGDDASGTDPAASGEPITAEAVAAVAIEHVDLEVSSGEVHTDEDDKEYAAELRFGADGKFDRGDLLLVHVSEPTTEEDICRQDENFDGCEWSEVEGGRLLVAWQEETPEEDPGIVLVVMQRDDEEVGVYYAGDSVPGDPREADLSISVETMQEIVQDEQLGLTTTPETIELGRETEDLLS